MIMLIITIILFAPALAFSAWALYDQRPSNR